MSQTATSTTIASYFKPPAVGVISLIAVIFGIAVGHTTLVLMRHWLSADHDLTASEIIASVILGSAGFYLVWVGRLRGEAVGTWLGFIAGTMMWIGFFELSWKIFAHALRPAPVTYEGLVILNPELQVIEASTAAFLVLMAFLTINKETRCNMMVWIRRQLDMDPGRPMTSKERNFAAVTALESIATTWACYIVTIICVDPRLIGNPMSTAAQLPFLAIFVWGIYLIWRLTKQKHMAPALRYAIGVGNVNWIWIEAGSRLKVYPEIWIKPLQYPLAMSAIAATLILAMTVMLRNRGARGAEPA